MVRFIALFVCCCFWGVALKSQTLSAAESRWTDSFVEWDIYAIFPPDTSDVTDSSEEAEPFEDLFGELRLRWLDAKNDWTEWDFRLADTLQGTIKQKWPNDAEQWELRTFDGSIVTMRTLWPRDLNQWRVTDNSITLNIETRWSNQLDEWRVKSTQYGTFDIHTSRSRDPRDWVVDDQLSEKVSLPMRMALLFLAIFHGSPRM